MDSNNEIKELEIKCVDQKYMVDGYVSFIHLGDFNFFFKTIFYSPNFVMMLYKLLNLLLHNTTLLCCQHLTRQY